MDADRAHLAPEGECSDSMEHSSKIPSLRAAGLRSYPTHLPRLITGYSVDGTLAGAAVDQWDADRTLPREALTSLPSGLIEECRCP